MTFKTALDNLCANYGKYGISRKEFSDLLKDGVARGFSVKAAYNGIKISIAFNTGDHEYFSVDDVAEITGETREEVLGRIEEMRSQMLARGEDPNKYFTPITPDNVNTFTLKL